MARLYAEVRALSRCSALHRSHRNATCGKRRAKLENRAHRNLARGNPLAYIERFQAPATMPDPKQRSIVIRDLESFEDLQQAEAVEKEVWALADRDVLPMTMAVATKAAGSIWIGAFDGREMAGFAFGFLGVEQGHLMLHSHMLAVREPYRDLDVGHKLKLAQRDRALAMRIQEITWTFDPLQSKNAHLNFGKLGVISSSYKIDFYGPETSSVLHRNGTDRLWVTWPMTSRRVRDRLEGKKNRPELLDLLSNNLMGTGNRCGQIWPLQYRGRESRLKSPAISFRLSVRIRGWLASGVWQLAGRLPRRSKPDSSSPSSAARSAASRGRVFIF